MDFNDDKGRGGVTIAWPERTDGRRAVVHEVAGATATVVRAGSRGAARRLGQPNDPIPGPRPPVDVDEVTVADFAAFLRAG
jgi:hypothetical protein